MSESTRRRLPLLVLVAGAVAFAALALLCRVLADENEQRLLQEQTAQAGAALAISVGQVEAPLDGIVRTAAATGGDPQAFARVAAPLTEAGGFSSVVLYRAGSTEPIAAIGAEPRLPAGGPAGVQRMLDATVDEPFVVVDLLDDQRTLGLAVRDDAPATFVVYGERRLRPDPNVRGRTDQPFSDFEYALYLGTEDTARLLGASVRDLPITGRRATTEVEFGDQRMLLVTTPIGRLGGRLMSDLWWIVLIGGAIGTAAVVALLVRLQRMQERAVMVADANAREQRQIAETLQRALLPERLDAPPGAELSARYWPANDADLVGGDFYDAFRIDEHRWGIVIGDVCGKGIEAAALTGLVRHTLRTAAHGAAVPSEALHAVHLAMREHRPATFCTVCFVVHELVPSRDGGPPRQRLTLSLGGHPMPLLVRQGEVTAIGQPGTVLGMIEPTLSDERVEVAPGDTLVLFTDGLTDAPTAERVSTDDLADLVRDGGPTAAEALADAIGDTAMARRPSGGADDTALLVVRFGLTGSPVAARPDDEDVVTASGAPPR